VSAGLDRDAVIEQDRNFLPKLLLRLCVRHGNVRATRLQEQGRRHPGGAQADHEYAFVVEIHRLIFSTITTETRRHGKETELKKQFKEHGQNRSTTRMNLFLLRVSVPPWWDYLSFNVVKANRANTSDAIQKRTIIFDSDQPSSSK
jgi:hypothetical protein